MSEVRYKIGFPVPIVLHCPKCDSKHLDEGEWATKPHKTHLCLSCKNEWRPYEFPTVGVGFVASKTNEEKLADWHLLWREMGSGFHPHIDDEKIKGAVLSYMIRHMGRLKRVPNIMLIIDVMKGHKKIPECGYIDCSLDFEHCH